MKYRVFSIIVSILLILCLSSCKTAQNNNTDTTLPAESQQPVNTTPIVSESDIAGIWNGGKINDGNHTQYLYFSSNGVYWMAKKSGTPSSSEFTSNSDYRVASSYSISVNNAGDTICSFGSWTATIYSSSSMSVSGRTISGRYSK